MADLDPNSAVGQASKAYDAFAKFFSDLAQALNAGSATPELSDYIQGLDYSELLNTAISGQLNNANYPGAAAVETVQHIAAVLREYGLRTKGKATYYTDGQSDTQIEADFYQTTKIVYVNMLQGNYVEGGNL